MSRILVVEDSSTQALQLRLLLEESGFEVSRARDGVDGLEAIGRLAPEIVLTDLEMPRMGGLELVENVRARYPSIPVVLITALGSEEVAIEALRRGAASYVSKRSMAQNLIPTLRRVLAASSADRHQHRVFECLEETEFAFRLENDASLVPPLVGYLREPIRRLRLCDETGLTRINLALTEALLNAIYHGNLEVSSDLRQDDERLFYGLADRRRSEPPYRDRKVSVRVSLSRREAAFVIRDEGPGFDPTRLPDPTAPANLERIGGRGLLLIRTFMDRVSHNAAGNEITMISGA